MSALLRVDTVFAGCEPRHLKCAGAARPLPIGPTPQLFRDLHTAAAIHSGSDAMRLCARQEARRAICRTLAMQAVFVVMLSASTATHALEIDLPFSDTGSSETASAIHDKLSAWDSLTDAAGRNVGAEIRSFYQDRNYRPAWSGSERARRSAQRARYALQHAYEQGLRPADYTSVLSDEDAASAKGNGAAAYDIEMTAGVLRYANDVRAGRLQPAQVYKDVGLPQQRYDGASGLNAALRRNSLDSFLDTLPPSHPEYRRLAAVLP